MDSLSIESVLEKAKKKHNENKNDLMWIYRQKRMDKYIDHKM